MFEVEKKNCVLFFSNKRENACGKLKATISLLEAMHRTVWNISGNQAVKYSNKSTKMIFNRFHVHTTRLHCFLMGFTAPMSFCTAFDNLSLPKIIMHFHTRMNMRKIGSFERNKKWAHTMQVNSNLVNTLNNERNRKSLSLSLSLRVCLGYRVVKFYL